SSNIYGIGFGTTLHASAGLRAKILDDDLLDMSVLLVQVTNRNQAVNAFFGCLADPDKNSSREGNRKLAGFANHTQTDGGMLVGSREVRHSLPRQPGADILEHQAKTGIDRLQ